MLSIEHKLVKIKKVTGVEEFKGDKRDYGCSVRIEWIAPNTILDIFDKDARPAFYERETGKPNANDEGQGELSLPRADVELTKRKLIYVETPIHFKKELDGYTITFHRGATEKSDITFNEVHLDDFTADPHDGGSVLMGCNAYMKPPVEQRGYIDHMSKTEIEITLTPPVAKQADLAPPKETKKKKTAAEKAGTEADPFANTDIPAAQAAAAEQASREGVAWPFPSGAPAQY
ncbi:hypothetical protein [Paraburkholderia sediminicola]|uniref:hypothetical protein n=1 Tax=Paraburkholderia sediminicola TaxID=458836 RepID=UPI0038BDBEBF